MHWFAAAVAAFILIALLWRLGSRWRSLPCPSWLRWFVELDNPFAREARAATILRHLGLQPGMAVVDLGCGPGRVSVPAARLIGPAGLLVAVDVQEGMLARAREKARLAGLTNLDFVQAGVGEGHLGADRFDAALLVTVLGEIPDRETALAEIMAALKPGGVLSITETVFDPHYQAYEVVAELGRAAGFREQARYGNRLAYTLHLQKPYR